VSISRSLSVATWGLRTDGCCASRRGEYQILLYHPIVKPEVYPWAGSHTGMILRLKLTSNRSRHYDCSRQEHLRVLS
jgi:hypothetical protein